MKDTGAFSHPMDSVITDALRGAVQKVFNDMAFLEAQTGQNGTPVFSQVFRIWYADAREQCGELLLCVPQELKAVIVENIHGRHFSEIDSAMADDCLMELLNVMAGLLLTAIYGQTAYRLGTPQVLFEKSLPHRDPKRIEMIFQADKLPFLTALYPPRKSAIQC